MLIILKSDSITMMLGNTSEVKPKKLNNKEKNARKQTLRN